MNRFDEWGGIVILIGLLSIIVSGMFIHHLFYQPQVVEITPKVMEKPSGFGGGGCIVSDDITTVKLSYWKTCEKIQYGKETLVDCYGFSQGYGISIIIVMPSQMRMFHLLSIMSQV